MTLYLLQICPFTLEVYLQCEDIQSCTCLEVNLLAGICMMSRIILAACIGAPCSYN